MRKLPLITAILLASCTSAVQRPALQLHYDRPATCFEEALPLGNGRLGAMVYGDPVHERISLNDITLWTGEPDSGDNHPDLIATALDGSGVQALKAVREALDREDYAGAERLQHRLQGHYSETYMPLGTMRLEYEDCTVSDYTRTLDLSDAVATLTCRRDGVPEEGTLFLCGIGQGEREI